MRLSGRAFRCVLVGGVLALGCAAYFGGRHLWGAYQNWQAEHAIARRDFKDATLHLHKAITVSPRNSALRLKAARTARRRGDYHEAVEHLLVCEQAKEETEAVALEYRLMQLQEGHLSSAKELLASCREATDTPETPLILEAYLDGVLKVLTRDLGEDAVSSSIVSLPEYVDACWAADLWLERCPAPADQAQGLVWRGRLSGMASDHRRAVTDLRRALELDPDSFQARWYLAAMIAQEDPADAESHLRILLERYPDNMDLRVQLARLYRNTGQMETARQMLDQMLESHSKSGPLLLERGRVEVDDGKPDRAEPWLRKAEAIDPEKPELLLVLGQCMRLAGRAQDAQDYDLKYQRADADRKKRIQAKALTSR